MNNKSSPVEIKRVTECIKEKCDWRTIIGNGIHYCPFPKCQNAKQRYIVVTKKAKPVIDTRKPKPRERLLEYNGEIHNVTEWSKILGISYDTIYARFKKGWDVEKTFSTPVLRKGRRKK